MNTMHRHNSWIAAIGALFAMAYPLAGAAAEDGRFEKLSVYLERNVQDHDAEIRFDVTGATDGLAALKVMAPGARTVIDLRSPDSKLGVRSLTLESPEPDDDKIVRADFPAGAYRFEGTTTKGAQPARRGAVEPRIPRTGCVRVSAAGPEGRTRHRSHPAMVRAEGDRGLRHRDRANRLGLRNPGTAAGFGKILHGT